MSQAIPETVATSLALIRTHRLMTGVTMEGDMEATVKTVIECFDEVGARWSLVGVHAFGVYVEPRATADFDFVVDDRKLKKILMALEQKLGNIGAVDIGAAIRLTSISVDLIRASSSAVFKAALSLSRPAGSWKVPPIEVLIVLKFLSGASPWRGRDKRAQDTLDLIRLYRSVDTDDLDRELMRTLAAEVYPGAERTFDELLSRVDHDEPIEI